MQNPRLHAFGIRSWSLILAFGLGWAFSPLPAFAFDSVFDDDDDEDTPTAQHADSNFRRRSNDWYHPGGPSTGRVELETTFPGRGVKRTGLDTGDFDPYSSPSNSMMDDPYGSELDGDDDIAPNIIAASGCVGGFLDLAAPVTMFFERYDDALGNNVPDRGEYFYAQSGSYRQAGTAPHAKGPPGINNGVNYQLLTSHIEYALSPRFSIYAELPAEWVHFNAANATSPGNTSGFGDMNAGFKVAFIAEADRYLTLQTRVYIPTGDSSQGLGTAHTSIEWGLLFYQRLNSRWIVQGEFKKYTPLDVTSYASNVIQYGMGVGYVAFQTNNLVVTPTLETVGWTFMGGSELVNGVQNTANGDTIVNINPGVRIGLTDVDLPSALQRHSLYFGWSRALTGQHLYQDMFRCEYRFLF